MIERLPSYYKKSTVVKDLYAVIQKILDKTTEDISVEDLRLFITTTSDFVLHEKDVGLSEIAVDNETKRARVLARLQGNNLLTKAELERLILIYDKTGCTITEDFANYTVIITFSGHKGIPYNFEQIKMAIDEVKPAHIRFEYDFLINTWGECRTKFRTWGICSGLTWYGAAYYYDGKE